MAHVFAIVNQKGGIGKTTIAVQFGVGLRRRGYRVLLIDMDAQCNLTFTLGGDYKHSPTILEAIFEEVNVKDTIQHLSEIDLIPGSINITTLEQQIEPAGKEFFLQSTIEPLLNDYDYIVIDSPPTISLITVGIMTAADSLIVPVLLDMYSMQGTGQLYKTYATVKKYCNPKLVIDGMVINRPERALKKMLDEIAEVMNCRVFETTISKSSRLKVATIRRQSIYKYAPLSQTRNEFDRLIDEVLSIRKTEGNGNGQTKNKR